MHRLDLALSKSFPVVQMPRYGDFDRLTTNGQRLLIANCGVFVEIRRDWLYAVQACGVIVPQVRIPYGAATPTVELAFGSAPEPLVEDFIELAREVAPVETAGAITFDAESRRLFLRACDIQSATPASVEYRLPALAGSESLAIDIHSHGRLPAFFSGQDDHDDRSATKIAIVVGKVDTPSPEICARLCLNGIFVPLSYPALSPVTDEWSNLETTGSDAILIESAAD